MQKSGSFLEKKSEAIRKFRRKKRESQTEPPERKGMDSLGEKTNIKRGATERGATENFTVFLANEKKIYYLRGDFKKGNSLLMVKVKRGWRKLI